MKTRPIVPLRTHLDHQLGGYVSAASATAKTNPDLLTAVVIYTFGLGGLALTPLANAEIIYTPTSQMVGKENAFSALPIDLNNDGIVDLTLSAYNFVSFSSGIHALDSLDAVGKSGNAIVASSHPAGFAVADVQGEEIGPGAVAGKFKASGLMARSEANFGSRGTGSSTRAGQWLNATNRYLGVKFLISGETHYGWARITARAGFATLTGYAYETIANKPIPAGATEEGQFPSGPNAADARWKRRHATLGALAHGADHTAPTQ